MYTSKFSGSVKCSRFCFCHYSIHTTLFFVIVQNLNHGCLPVSTCMHLVIWHFLYIHNFIFWKYNTCPYLKHMFWSCAKMMTVSIICIAKIVFNVGKMFSIYYMYRFINILLYLCAILLWGVLVYSYVISS